MVKLSSTFCLLFIVFSPVWIRISIRNINPDSQKYQILNTDTAWIQIYNTDSYHLTATLLEDVLGPEGVAARDGQVQHRVALH